MLQFLSQPWPWWVAGPLIGLVVPALLILGNKPFGISSTLRHICAACIPAKIPFFQYNWKEEQWNLYFVAGIFLGALLASTLIANPNPIALSENTVSDLKALGITDFSSYMPVDIFSWSSLLSLKGFVFILLGGFLVGFGTRYGNGCTSGHVITGISNLQWPSLVATCCFMIGGILTTWFIIPLILS
jgi:uncharacterized membrane protein YedE/YeeE